MVKNIITLLFLSLVFLSSCSNKKNDKPVFIGNDPRIAFKNALYSFNNNILTLNTEETTKLEKLYTYLIANVIETENNLKERDKLLSRKISNSFLDCGLSKKGIFCHDEQVKGLKLDNRVIIKNGIKSIVKTTQYDRSTKLLFLYNLDNKTNMVSSVTVYSSSDNLIGINLLDSPLTTKLFNATVVHIEIAHQLTFQRAAVPKNARRLAHMFRLLFLNKNLKTLAGITENVFSTLRTSEDNLIRRHLLETIADNIKIHKIIDNYETYRLCAELISDNTDVISNLAKIIMYQSNERLFSRRDVLTIIDRSKDFASKQLAYKHLFINTGVWAHEDCIDIIMYDLMTNQKHPSYSSLTIKLLAQLGTPDMSSFHIRFFKLTDIKMTKTLIKLLNNPYFDIKKDPAMTESFEKIIIFSKSIILRDIRLWKVTRLLMHTTGHETWPSVALNEID